MKRLFFAAALILAAGAALAAAFLPGPGVEDAGPAGVIAPILGLVLIAAMVILAVRIRRRAIGPAR